jgi:hypothetical protein
MEFGDVQETRILSSNSLRTVREFEWAVANRRPIIRRLQNNQHARPHKQIARFDFDETGMLTNGGRNVDAVGLSGGESGWFFIVRFLVNMERANEG